MSTEEKIKELIAEQLGCRLEEVTNESSFVDDLGADSLDEVELIMLMEDEFAIEIKDEEVENIKTVEEAINLIKKTIGE